MTFRIRRPGARRVVALATSLAVVAAPLWVRAAPAAFAAGESTPGVTVMAKNPPHSRSGSLMKLTLTAHSEATAVTAPSCRPQDVTLECWGSVVLRVPDFGNLVVGGFEVHRVAVGDISCDDTSGDDGCGDHDMGVLASASTESVMAQVNGVGYVKRPGSTGLDVGTKLQLKFTLTDNGPRRYGDLVVVQISLFTAGHDKPLLYRSPPETIRQVRILYVDAAG